MNNYVLIYREITGAFSLSGPIQKLGLTEGGRLHSKLIHMVQKRLGDIQARK